MRLLGLMHPRRARPMNDIAMLGVDLVQSVFQLHGASTDVARFEGTLSTAA